MTDAREPINLTALRERTNTDPFTPNQPVWLAGHDLLALIDAVEAARELYIDLIPMDPRALGPLGEALERFTP